MPHRVARVDIPLHPCYTDSTLKRKRGISMPVWVVHAGVHGEFEQFAIDNSVVGIRFGLTQSVTDFPSREALRQHIQNNSAANQLWRFAHGVNVGETVVLPGHEIPRVVAVGRITGPYRYEPDWPYPHILPVEWAAVDIPRINFDQDLLYSFGGLLTVFQVNRTNAQERIDQVVLRHRGEGIADIPAAAELADDGDNPVDWDEVITDQIIERIRQKFTGHRLEYLVAEILKAQGYTTSRTGRGADGGIDIVAGKGEMGFAEPRLCVQVKSVTAAVDVDVYRGLQGILGNVGANHGLLVSLSDFTRNVRRENERSFFQIRLWGSDELVKNLVDTYDKLPSEIRADIPLADRKVLLETEV